MINVLLCCRSAPEMLWGSKCTEKADIYSYGIVLYEICTQEKPIRGQLRDIRVPEECPEGIRSLILECLETRPSRRPTAQQIVERLRLLGAEGPPRLRGEIPSPDESATPLPVPMSASGPGSRRASTSGGRSSGGRGHASPAGTRNLPSGTQDGAPNSVPL